MGKHAVSTPAPKHHTRRRSAVVTPLRPAPAPTSPTSTPFPSAYPHAAPPTASTTHAPARTPTTPATDYPVTEYFELHCHSHFSFLDGVSSPEALVQQAVTLGYTGLTLTDHNGLYGVVRFAQAAAEHGLATAYGAEVTLGSPPGRTGMPDPEGEHLILLARSPEGYQHLSAALSDAAMLTREKGTTDWSFDGLAALCATGTITVLTGGRKGILNTALNTGGPDTAARALAELQEVCPHLYIELTHHDTPQSSERLAQLVQLADRASLPYVAAGGVHAATRSELRLAHVTAAIRANRTLDELDGWLPSHQSAYLRSRNDLFQRYRRYPEALHQTAALGREIAFDLQLVAPKLPQCAVPPGRTPMSHLTELALRGAHERYGHPASERVKGAYQQIHHELEVIEKLDFSGYFLIVHDIVEFCRHNGILCQGRGSAANSAVCYALGITNADAVRLGLLFERFLSPERDGPPDIDLDIESARREEVIQYVYNRYGRERAAQVCNVITYRSRSALRDVMRAFGTDSSHQEHAIKPSLITEYVNKLRDAPRHLGIHSGGMVLCDRPVAQVCPTEWARMPNRHVLQWDKDDCAAMGLVKFDLLGLGMLTMLRIARDLIIEHFDPSFSLAHVPQDDVVYDMLSAGDAIGVFQVESRAQLTTLPRIQPRNFYDLVVEIALIRPGPIQGGSVHPYLRRRNGKEPVTYLHPSLEPALKKTLGVPLFQEQLMQIAIDAAGFTPAEADQLRTGLGAKRSRERLERLHQRLLDGLAARGINRTIGEQIFEKIAAFANYGFPESHAVSFAFLVYASAWIKYFYPQCFLAGLLNAQPMGFWAPHSLVADAMRHGVRVLPPDLNYSQAQANIVDNNTVRMGLSSLHGISLSLAKQLVEAQPFATFEDVALTGLVRQNHLETLAISGSCRSLGLDRRGALWAAGALTQASPRMGRRGDQLRLPGMATVQIPSNLPKMSPYEQAVVDLATFGASPTAHILSFFRDQLHDTTSAAALGDVPDGTKVFVAGVVTHRQRPPTAHGVTFVNLEDETGMVNVVCSQGFWQRYLPLAATEPAVIIRGVVTKDRNVATVRAESLTALRHTVGSDLANILHSRDFR